MLWIFTHSGSLRSPRYPNNSLTGFPVRFASDNTIAILCFRAWFLVKPPLENDFLPLNTLYPVSVALILYGIIYYQSKTFAHHALVFSFLIYLLNRFLNNARLSSAYSCPRSLIYVG